MRDIQTFIHRLSLRSQALMPWDGDRAVGLQPLLLGWILLAEFLQKKWSRNHFSFKSAINKIENPTQNDAEEKETQETIRTWNSFPALRYSEIQHLHEFCEAPGRKKAQPPRGRVLQQVQEPQELQELHCPLRTRPAQPEIESWTATAIGRRFSVDFYPFHSFSPYVSLSTSMSHYIFLLHTPNCTNKRFFAGASVGWQPGLNLCSWWLTQG